MKRVLALVVLLAGCVSVEPAIETKGAIRPGQRLVVMVYQSPGPWIVSEADSKAEAAAKILPVGFLVQTAQEDRVLTVSKDLQQYLPRPPYAQEVRKALVEALKGLHDGPVETAAEAGIEAARYGEWNHASDQLDWRRRYYALDPESPAPRDYSRLLTLDDAIVVDVNVSYGTEAEAVPNDLDKLSPAISAATRVYRGGTVRQLWSHEDALTDKVSSRTLSEFKIDPVQLTDRIYKLAPDLGRTVAQQLAKAFELHGSGPAPAAAPSAPPPPGQGLLDLTQTQFSVTESTTAGATGGTFTSTAPAVIPPAASTAPAPAQ